MGHPHPQHIQSQMVIRDRSKSNTSNIHINVSPPPMHIPRTVSPINYRTTTSPINQNTPKKETIVQYGIRPNIPGSPNRNTKRINASPEVHKNRPVLNNRPTRLDHFLQTKNVSSVLVE